jgi:protein PsiE
MLVRFMLYVGITALTRHRIGYVQKDAPADAGILILAGATLILAFAVLVARYALAVYGSGSAKGETKAD